MPGVLDYVDIKDIPAGGTNNWKRFGTPEPVFASTRSEYAGQAIGLIVAETRAAAVSAAAAVNITYANQGPVIVDMAAAMAADPTNNVQVMGGPVSYGDVDAALAAADTVVSGRFRMGSQYHFHMETHVCIARPKEDGLDILVPTQVRDAGTVPVFIMAKYLNKAKLTKLYF
jgi:xanthine dehydrogenase molybdopterin-binding subunit B